MVILSGPSSDARLTAQQALVDRQQGIRLFAVGVGQRPSGDELASIAASPVDVYRFNFSDLASGFAEKFICLNLATSGI